MMKIVSDGKMKNGKKEGLWVEYTQDGKLKSKGFYTDGRKHGLFSKWFENNPDKKRLSFEPSPKVKPEKLFFRVEEFWNHGVRHGIERTYVNDLLSTEKYWYNNHKFGVWRVYSQRGDTIEITRTIKFIYFKYWVGGNWEGDTIEIVDGSKKVSEKMWEEGELVKDHPVIITRSSLPEGYSDEDSGIGDYWLGDYRYGFNYEKYYDEVIKPFEEKFKETIP